MDTRHASLVVDIARQVKTFYGKRKPFRVYHGSTNSTRITTFDRTHMVDVSGLNRVLHVDTKRKVAVVEPNVPMDKLVEATLPHGLVPPVVMEFPGITVGGGLQGGAGESSSFRWGTFNRTLNWYEMILGNGKIIKASPRKHADLFWGAAGSYGSLGVVTAAEIQLVPACRYVELEYIPVHSFEEAVKTLRRAVTQKIDFVDGILYAPDRGVIMVGTMTDKPSGPIRTFSRARDEWFYLHAEKIARSGQLHRESISLQDYLFRYDRGAFWMGKHAFARLRTPFNRLTRWLLNPLLHTRKMYEALQASGISQECIIQDLAIPAENTVQFLQFIDKTYGIYPLWLCPLLPDEKSPLLSSALKTKAVINVGVWSHYSSDYDQVITANKLLEKHLRKLGGRKWLYAYAYYTPQQFWRIYDQKWYNTLRQKYHATTLPSVYDKTCRPKRQPISAKRGVIYALLGLNAFYVRKS